MNISTDDFGSAADPGTLSRLRHQLGLAAEAEGLLDVAFTTVDSPVGPLLLAATPKGLVRVAYAIEDHDRVLDTLARQVSPRVLRAPQRLDTAARELEEYFQGQRRSFDLPLDLSLSRGFRLLVQQQLPSIGYGQTRSYRQVAELVGNPKAVRAVGTACATNPLPVVLPCHRVLRSDGTPGGYAGGTAAKTHAPEPGGSMSADPWKQRVDAGDWTAITAEVNEYGGALLPELLTAGETGQIRDLYEDDGCFRATINMGRHRFGEGEYRYFKAPYPEPVERLKQALYPRLLPIARDWHARLGRPAPWPDTLDEWLRMCHDAGQVKPTAILLRYGQGDWNALHRDLYGDLVFPLQVVINLNEPGADHTGGEFLLLEQRPRAQSRGTATLLPHGHGYVFTTRDRPVRSARGWSAAPVRHGVSAIRSGQRHTLGLVFHDAA